MSTYVYNIGLLFSKVAAQYASNVALAYPGGQVVSYRELDELSWQFAHLYTARGIKQGEVVAILNDKSVHGYAAMLGALKCGIIYTNLDPTSPYQRLSKIVDRCKPALLLYDTEVAFRGDLDSSNIQSLNLYDVDFSSVISTQPNKPLSTTNSVLGNDGAYIMFTSGSTGFPKGAVITHANLINFIQWGINEYSITPQDVCTNANPIYFDNSVFDIYVTLFSGATLVPLKGELTKDPFSLVNAVNQAGCTSWFSVPSLLIYLMTTKVLTATSLPTIKRFIFGGEGFPKPKLKKLYDMYKGNARLYNVYGPTECTCICSSYEVNDDDFEDMNSLTTLGYLAPNFGYTLINTNDEGNFGELCLKGPNVGAGYYNDPERTQNAFIQDPTNPYYPSKVYRCGDLVEVDATGKLHFKGRADNQIKHMGYRIELEEIEAMLNTVKHVNEAAVIYDRISESLGQIIAFVSVHQSTEEQQILAELKGLLPDYMVPKRVHIAGDALPKNQNGKIDRIALKELKAKL